MTDWRDPHPSPTFRRKQFLSLDSCEWTLNEKPIRVPFPPQASLSGWTEKVPETMRYRTTFRAPEYRPDERVILHFGAVDQCAYVFVNGRPAVHHDGGYLPFEADITDSLLEGENDLDVEAIDTLSKRFPYGKQSLKPKGMWYTPVSGIWQSVWLEVVPQERIRDLDIQTDLKSVSVTVFCDPPEASVTIDLGNGETLTRRCLSGETVRVDIPEPKLWTPETPSLYPISVRAGKDEVRSYAALRTIAVREAENGKPAAILLNGKPVFLAGVLDQGYWPEGLFLPECPEDYEQDIHRLKAMGFNTIRKHLKVEPQAFYEACDKLGMLVIQDMVNSGSYHFFWDTVLPTIGIQRRADWLPGDPERRAFFEQHCLDTEKHLRRHPCVIAYTIFNEGWGQYHTDRLYETLKSADPSRLIISSSGWFRGHRTDVDARHVYFRNKKLRPGKKPMLLAECGGYRRAIEGLTEWQGKPYGYGRADTEEALTSRITALYASMVLPAVPQGLCGVVYTQMCDVEGEINGLYTRGRECCKVQADQLYRLNQACRDRLASKKSAEALSENGPVRD